MDIPEIAGLLAEARQDALKMTATSDLRPLRRKLSKLAALTTTTMPHSWTSLHDLAQEQARSLLWAERCEADLPEPVTDAFELRKAAGTQLMLEAKSVLNNEEQQALAKLMWTASNRLLAKQGKARPAAPGDPPGTPPPERNGKTQPRLEP
jgi:hypothetical protein